MEKRRIGVFGGTFNPVHNGHINLVKNYRNMLSLDEIIVIPTNIPPHKANLNVIDSQDRIAMLNLAFEDEKYVSVSDIEIAAGGTSYTILTIEKLKETYPNDELFLLVGGDMFLCFESWREYKRILSLCTVCTAPRQKDEILKLIRYQEKIDPSRENTIILDSPVLELSSSEIREKITDKTFLRGFVPQKVFEYILKKGLYEND